MAEDMFLTPGYTAAKLQILATRHGDLCPFRNSCTYFCNRKVLAT